MDDHPLPEKTGKSFKETFLERLRAFKKSRIGSKYEAIITVIMLGLAIYGVLYDVPQVKLQTECAVYCRDLINCSMYGSIGLRNNDSGITPFIINTTGINLTGRNLSEPTDIPK